jgi:hypothetical protein
VITATVIGASEIKKALQEAAKAVQNAAAAALYQKASAVMADSVKMCPVKTGRLRNTHYVTKPHDTGRDMVIEIGYGTAYAIYVHEMPDNYNFTAPNTGPKYLQRAVESHMSGWAQWIASKTKDNFRNGVGIKSIGGDHPTRPEGG